MTPFDFHHFSDPGLVRDLVRSIEERLDQPLVFMEVCGTHTVSIFQSGLRSLFPEGLVHLSGPGCPVCVTHGGDIGAFLDLASRDDVILATFGDMMRVPGPDGQSLKSAKADGARVKVCYSPLEALDLAGKTPDSTVVFLGVGFETTAPAVAATVKQARMSGIGNFCVYSCHKLIPPALKQLLDSRECQVQAFLLPGHVSTVIGTRPYEFLAREHRLPAVVTGFEPLDILQALNIILKQRQAGQAEVVNQYTRGVDFEGNARARAMLEEVFEVRDAQWRGLGLIPASGLGVARGFERFDARVRFDVHPVDAPEPPGCRCGEVLQGLIRPDECPLFATRCTPAEPVGPCMVSTEGSCAAFYKYR
jgi:hydrogenase expression/formation protein HypD